MHIPRPQKDPPERAHADIWLGDHEERDDVTQKYPGEENVTQLPAGCADYRRVIVPYERSHDEYCSNDAEHRQENWNHRPGRVPVQLGDGDGLAGRAVGVGPHVEGAEFTGELVVLVLVTVAGLAVPAARHALHHLLPLAGFTGQAADGAGNVPLTQRPLHVLDLLRQMDTNHGSLKRHQTGKLHKDHNM